MKRFRFVSAVLLALMLSFAAITAVPQDAHAIASAVVLSDSSIKVTVGKKYQLSVLVRNYPMTQKVTWKSSDKKIATVSKKGVVKGKKAGKCKITAYYDGWKVDTCKVKVVKKKSTKNK